jgi:hypothetical protein
MHIHKICFIIFHIHLHLQLHEPGSSVGIATGYRLDGPGIESRLGARFSAPVQNGPGAHQASCTMGTGSFTGVTSGRGVTLTPHSRLVPWSWKGRAILYSPYRPYSLYRASVPVQGCTLPFFYSYSYSYTTHMPSTNIRSTLLPSFYHHSTCTHLNSYNRYVTELTTVLLNIQLFVHYTDRLIYIAMSFLLQVVHIHATNNHHKYTQFYLL